MNIKTLIVSALCIGALTFGASAQDRYGQRPPVVLSPDLTAPWVTQLRQKGTAHGAGTVVRKRRAISRQTVNRRHNTRVASVRSSRAKQTPQMNPVYLPQLVDYATSQKPGTIVIDTPNRFLYLVLGNGKARRYGVGVGKPGFEWAGTHRVTRKAEWPDWRPPAQMIEREKKKGRILPTFMPGGPANPMGARALYLGSTLYRIHGTNQPWTIGAAVSSGCIRMRNEDVVDLYERVGNGTKVIVI
ncbi:L,D-transpeptidase [Hoeflea poritis]|uniref:L,D-transpeptidase n=1 Tax=Hoeflea poritis TaxID=2993659 RepID=A0ABT4VSE1_9HYPH|nr:L,D-transpeptidase [Hoeflea poritis]MDA4847624.1 L,D-transpeptidase [Hoeflea poritis]